MLSQVSVSVTLGDRRLCCMWKWWNWDSRHFECWGIQRKTPRPWGGEPRCRAVVLPLAGLHPGMWLLGDEHRTVEIDLYWVDKKFKVNFLKLLTQGYFFNWCLERVEGERDRGKHWCETHGWLPPDGGGNGTCSPSTCPWPGREP